MAPHTFSHRAVSSRFQRTTSAIWPLWLTVGGVLGLYWAGVREDRLGRPLMIYCLELLSVAGLAGSLFSKEVQRVSWFNAEKTAGFENFTYEGFGELYSYGFLLNRKTAALPQWIHRGDNRRPRGQTDHCTLVLRRIQVASTQGFRKRSL